MFLLLSVHVQSSVFMLTTTWTKTLFKCPFKFFKKSNFLRKPYHFSTIWHWEFWFKLFSKSTWISESHYSGSTILPTKWTGLCYLINYFLRYLRLYWAKNKRVIRRQYLKEYWLCNNLLHIFCFSVGSQVYFKWSNFHASEGMVSTAMAKPHIGTTVL